jgi:hypothetical protein
MPVTFNLPNKRVGADSPSIALLYWYVAQGRNPEPDRPKPGARYHRAIRHPSRGKGFLQLVMWACERQLNLKPKLDLDKVGPGPSYEDACLFLLYFLAEHGLLSNLQECDAKSD